MSQWGDGYGFPLSPAQLGAGTYAVEMLRKEQEEKHRQEMNRPNKKRRIKVRREK